MKKLTVLVAAAIISSAALSQQPKQPPTDNKQREPALSSGGWIPANTVFRRTESLVVFSQERGVYMVCRSDGSVWLLAPMEGMTLPTPYECPPDALEMLVKPL